MGCSFGGVSTKGNGRLTARAAVEREYEVLQMHIHGATSVEIARKLDIAPRSVFRVLERNRKKGAEQTITAADRSVYAQEQLAELAAVRFRLWGIFNAKGTGIDARISAARAIVDAVARESRITGTEKVVAKIEMNADKTIPLAAARTILERAAVANRFESARQIAMEGEPEDVDEQTPDEDRETPSNPNACRQCHALTVSSDLEVVTLPLDDGGGTRRVRLCKSCRRNLVPRKESFIRA